VLRFSRIKSQLRVMLVGYQIEHRTWRDRGKCEHKFTFAPTANVRAIHYELFEIQKGGIIRPKEIRYCLRNLNTRLYRFYDNAEALLSALQIIYNRQRQGAFKQT